MDQNRVDDDDHKVAFHYFMIYVLVPKYLIKKKYLIFMVVFLISAIIGGMVIWFMDFYYVGHYVLSYNIKSFWHLKGTYKILDLVYIASLPTTLKLLQGHIRQEKITLQIAEQKLSAELQLLKNQLQPHFLFNTLNNLYGMVLTQHPKAADVVIRLSEMMSYMLYECEVRSIALEKEIANLENYIALEKVRYGNRLDVSFETGGNISGKMTAPLLFIPFVENAFKHGVEKNENPSWVRINLWVEGVFLYFMIENSIPDEFIQDKNTLQSKSGIGLKNVEKRLELLYPNAHMLDIKKEDTYLVQLKIHFDDEMLNRR